MVVVGFQGIRGKEKVEEETVSYMLHSRRLSKNRMSEYKDAKQR